MATPSLSGIGKLHKELFDDKDLRRGDRFLARSISKEGVAVLVTPLCLPTV